MSRGPTVRSALVWLGLPDPVASMNRCEELIRYDSSVPRCSPHGALNYRQAADQVADVVDFACTRPGLRAALLEVAASRDGRDEISGRRLGKWLVRNENI